MGEATSFSMKALVVGLIFLILLVFTPFHNVFASQMGFQSNPRIVSSSSTPVGGIIWENTTWMLEDSPYEITETVQIPEDVILMIEAGVTVSRPTAGDMFLLHGKIHAHGTIDNKIIFDGGDNSNFFSGEGTWNIEGIFLDLEYCVIRNGISFWPAIGSNRLGSFSLKYSDLINLTSFSYVWYPERDIYIQYNRFINTAGFTFGTSDQVNVYIEYNLFKNANRNTDYCIQTTRSTAIAKYNSFVDMEGIVLRLAGDSATSATENYWGTLDTDVIDSMIYDRNDDINCAGYIDYLPILSEPHPDTPKVSSTINVDDDNVADPWDGTVEHPYQNITQALKHASDNDTIFVFNGTYYENVVLNKTVSLIGENRETTIIDANRTGNVVCIKAEHITVTGFTIQNSGPEGYGIYLFYGSSYSNISRNIIKNNKWGIRSETGRPPAHDFNIIVGNEVLQSRYAGIELTLCDNNVIANNTISDGILLHSSIGNVISGNNIPHGGMNIRYGSINLKAVSNSTIIHNNVSGGNVIRLDGSDNNEIAANNIRGGQRAIVLEDSHDNIITRNNISESDYQAIYMFIAQNNTISNNNAVQNDGGFYLMRQCTNNIISNNVISYNSFDALYLDDYSDKNTLINNTISFSNRGIYIRNSWYNVIFHNNFINNTQQVTSTDSQNTWDGGYPSGGNYWSDYTGVDLYSGPFQNGTGCDGIGDTPYVIDENNQDNYPLMKPYPDTTPPIITIVSPENKAYATTSIPLVFTIDECTCWIGYSVDGELNVTITGNTTLTLSESSHWIKVYANDTHGNMGCSETISFMVDITLPNTIHDYDGEWRIADFTITLTAIDHESGVAETYYRINDGIIKTISTDGQPFIATESANNTLEYWSIDKAGNEELPHKILTGIKLDKTPPSGFIVINENATYTNSLLVTLTLSANDSTSGVALMRFSNDNITWASWETYNNSKVWTLKLGDRTKTVYVQFMDNTGLISNIYKDHINLSMNLEVHCVDGDNKDLSGLTVKLHNSTGHLIETKTTNSSDWVKFASLLPDNYTVTAYWYGIQVANYTVEVTSDTVVDPLLCGVYDYYIHVLDGDGEDVEDANLVLYLANGIYFTSSLTNATGWAEFTNLPNTTYNIRTLYQGVQVSILTDTLSIEDQNKTVNAGIFDLYIHCVDGDLEDLENVLVRLYNSSGLVNEAYTNSSGYIEFTQLPNTTYTYNVTYFGVKVGEGSLTLSLEEQTEVASLSIYDLVVHIVDEKDNDLPNADVTLSWLNGTEISSSSTNSTGHIVFENLPSKTYSIKVTLKGYKDQMEYATLTSEDQIETITMQLLAIPFIETPLGRATIVGVISLGVALAIFIFKRRGAM